MALTVEETKDVFWEGLDFTLYPATSLSSDDRAALRRFLEAWHVVGVNGGFGPSEDGKGVMHHMSDVLFKDDGSIEWWVDMGSAPDIAVDGLVHALELFAEEHRVEFTKLVLGWHDSFTADETI